MDKNLIKRRFARSAASYAAAATVQRNMAEQLCDLLTTCSAQCNFDRVFEIGCGSGGLTDVFTGRFAYCELILNDLVPECGEKLPRDSVFLPGDAENIAIPAKLDLVMSNAVFQWLNDPSGLLAKLYAAMNADAWLLFSTFGPENCRELCAAGANGLSYRTAEEWQTMLNAAGFAVQACHAELQTLEFADPLEVLRHLRETGVTGVGGGEKWTQKRLEQFCERYRAHAAAENGGVTLTYHPLLFAAVKGSPGAN